MRHRVWVMASDSQEELPQTDMSEQSESDPRGAPHCTVGDLFPTCRRQEMSSDEDICFPGEVASAPEYECPFGAHRLEWTQPSSLLLDLVVLIPEQFQPGRPSVSMSLWHCPSF